MIRRFHRWNALALGAFLILHFLNHLFVTGGIENHLSVQALLRNIYRFPGVEHALITLFFTQVALGVILSARRGVPKGLWAWLQIGSGVYLVLFIVQHLGAILLARMGGLDTNSYFAAAVVSRPPFVWYFAPYYVLGITAIFIHIAAALRFRVWPRPAPLISVILPFAGLVIGMITVAGLMGAFGDFSLPREYDDYLKSFE
ncbi:hypothetical protein [Hyphomonas sp.]|uniref:hypothetical protein n=1 Tax=Hyphomonas sp. TaxID=87 RepID=UPI0025C303F1|nr:hypothetical protein [Hyphomonas sp.]